MGKIELESVFGTKLEINIEPYEMKDENLNSHLFSFMINDKGFILKEEEMKKIYNFIKLENSKLKNPT
ncbi:MAG: hypothetical protein ACTSWY_03730 [Promethearchaeota archaeon]